MTDKLREAAQRNAFEAWCVQRWAGDRNALARNLPEDPAVRYSGEYTMGNVEFGWQAWRAALAEQAAPDAPKDTMHPKCTQILRAAGKPYPRTCAECGLGPCRVYGSAALPTTPAPAAPVAAPAALPAAAEPVAWKIVTPNRSVVYDDIDPRDNYTQEWMDDCFEIAPLYAAPQAVPAPQAEQWKCFHCGEAFSDTDSARLHFGPTEHSQPICQIDAGEYRRMEEVNRRHCEEDTDLHREIHRLECRHQQALMREEEKGYARGLADAAPPPADAAPRKAALDRMSEDAQRMGLDYGSDE